jgi:hypothetical protein
VVRSGRVADSASGNEAIAGVHQLVNALAAREAVDATAIQTVGAKGYDGFILALVGDKAVACGYQRRLPPLILALNCARFARFALRACLAAAVAALELAGASDHTHGTRPRPRYGALLGVRVMSPSARRDSRARRMEAMRL